MKKQELNKILQEHNLWLRGDKRGKKADFQKADLQKVNFSLANSNWVDLAEANLTEANLAGANLMRVNFSEADFWNANLKDANLKDANLTGANLRGVALTGADLTGANLTETNFNRANLMGVDLTGASLWGANLKETNLSGVTGLIASSDWMKDNFEQVKEGFIVYKAIGRTDYPIPEDWVIEPNSYITEIVNFYRTSDCGCGVNFGTKKWVENQYRDQSGNRKIWKCLLHWIDLADLVVPYNTSGKARCGRLQLLEKIK